MEEDNSSDEEHEIQTFSTNIDLETFYQNYEDEIGKAPEGHAMDYVHIIMEIEKV